MEQLEQFTEFRSILREAIACNLPNHQVGLLFSGGTDSLAIFWLLLDLQVKFTCYVFRLEDIVSKDSKAARLACKFWDVPLVEIIIPHQEPVALADDIRKLIWKIKTSRKTAIECTWPFTHVVSYISEPVVYCGLNADDLWGSSKSMILRYRHDPEGFRAKRIELMSNPYASGWNYIEELFLDKEIHLFSPYRHPSIINYLLQFNWKQLNCPVQKMPVYVAFNCEFNQLPIWRKNDNLQCGSGIREYLARLLFHPSINPENYSSMVKVYRGIEKQRTNGYQLVLPIGG